MPSARREYTDQHRVFLQGVMNRGIMNLAEVKALHRACKVRTGMESADYDKKFAPGQNENFGTDLQGHRPRLNFARK